jgi:hypothetical protein
VTGTGVSVAALASEIGNSTADAPTKLIAKTAVSRLNTDYLPLPEGKVTQPQGLWQGSEAIYRNQFQYSHWV